MSNPFCRRHATMLVKLTSKNRLTLPKAVTQAVGPAECFEVEVRDGQIVLTPVWIQRADAVRTKLAALEVSEADVVNAVSWARSAEPAATTTEAAEPRSKGRRLE